MVDFAASLEAREAEANPRASAFAAAARHSARVRLLRVGLASGAFGAIAVLMAVAIFDPFGRLTNSVSIGSIGVSGTKVTMAHPRLAGFRKDGRPYLVTAREAVQDALHPTLVELHGISADIAVEESGQAHMTARTGLYDSTNEHMDVSDDVEVKSPQYSAWLTSASIDFQSGQYESDHPVRVVTSSGTTLTGDAMNAVDNGKELVIEGHVRTLIPPMPATDGLKAHVEPPNQ